MKKILCFIIVMCLISSNVYAETKNASVVAMSAILMDADSGRVLWEKNSNTPIAIASTTKIMTCILALEKAALKDEVLTSKRAASAPEVKMHLSVGEKQRLEDLLYALMLQSSNDAAIAIAEHIGGSVEGFCAMMTDKAKELGAKDTVFETPNGLDSGNHHSTAYDMALITRYAFKNADFVRIINTREVTTPVSGGRYKAYHIANKNRLLAEYEGANGVKSGFTNKAGHCFVGSATREGVSLISVVLASGWGTKGKEQKWIDTKSLLNYGFKNYHYKTVIKKGDMAEAFNVSNSPLRNSASAYYSEGLELLLSDEENKNVKVEIKIPNTIEAPIYIGNVVGTAKIYLNDENIKNIELYANENIEAYKFKDWLTKIKNEFLNIKQ
jgi:D-alanyl-D-alanine carboxypeptidase (penicillin-binding protein 5/6)